MLFAFLAAASAATPSPICQKLTAEFDRNEHAFAVTHSLDASLLDIEEQAWRAMEASRHEAAMAAARARAVGGYAPPVDSSTDRAKVDDARDELLKADEHYKTEGDRITTLLIANKCQPPDHVTSWQTYIDTIPKSPND